MILYLLMTFRNSTIRQQILFYGDSRRIDFRTEADWHEHQILLKAAFPVDIASKEITCEIQYGAIKRNLTRENSWDKAKFECCAHSWMDISEDDGSFGVAVLNDCKYGYDAKEKLMRLTLIKSGIFPNPEADQGKHLFTYSLLPHLGDYRQGKVIQEAKELNYAEHCYLPGGTTAGLSDVLKSVIDLNGEDGVFVGAVKMAEDNNDVIIRLYEGFGRDAKVKATLFKALGDRISVEEVYECDLLEIRLPQKSIISDDSRKNLTLGFMPYEIKTIRIKIK